MKATRSGKNWLLALTLAAGLLSGVARSEESGPAAPLKIQGYCVVSYFEDNKAVKGDPNIRSVYADDTYYFAKEEYKKKFEANPEKYLPNYGSWCPLALGGPYGNKFESDPAVFMVKDGQLYLFSSERAKNAYLAQPAGVLQKATERFQHPWLAGYCPVALTEEKKGTKGDAKYAVIFRRLAFYCSSPEAKAKFAKDPKKYLPEYAGFDAIHLAEEKFIVGSGEHLSVVDGKVYMFLNEENKKKFDENPQSAIALADPMKIQLVAFR